MDFLGIRDFEALDTGVETGNDGIDEETERTESVWVEDSTSLGIFGGGNWKQTCVCASEIIGIEGFDLASRNFTSAFRSSSCFEIWSQKLLNWEARSND